LPPIALKNGIEIPEMFEGLKRVQTSIVDRQTLAVLYSNAKPQWTWVDKRRQLTPDPAGQARIVLFDEMGQSKILAAFEISTSWVHFAMLPTGGWVVARSKREIAKSAHDTIIYDAGGNRIQGFDAGSAIGFLQTTASGQIWIGHEDDDPGDKAKWGGLSLFSPGGEERLYSWFKGFEGSPDFGMAFWCCYALNVTGEAAWTQFYTDMLVSRTEPDGSQQHWRCWPKGAVALIVQGDVIALAGRYDETQNDIMAYRLGEPPHATSLGQLRFSIEGEQPKCLDSITGKGDTFHIVHDNKWYRITLDDILARLPPPQ
jgi:hypothetical protein